MSQNINWANPVFDVKTSQNYLARLQEFLATQQPGGSASTSTSNGGPDGSAHKRKNPSTADEVDTTAAIKDRKHAPSRSVDQATHSHAKEGSSERESPEADGQAGNKGRASKNSTSDKRKEQNRNAQRAFRERKERVVKDLEDKVSELQRNHENTVSENQNLKELISRLQEENAKLRSTSAPQSDFTFTIPSAPAQTSAPAFNNSSLPSSEDKGNSSLSNTDILTLLSSAQPPAQPSQTPFTMINPSPPIISNNSSTTGSLDDWINNWNSSAFGTELPQAVPPSVTNLAEQPADNGFASLWNSLNQNNSSTFDILQNQQVQQQNANDTNNTFFSLFQNAFSPSLDGNTSAPNSFSQYVNSSNTAPYNTTQSPDSSMFPFANASGSGSPAVNSNISNNNTGAYQAQRQNSNSQNRPTATNSSNADSPETCASSTSGGSDPSDAQPGTPNNGQALFGSNNKAKAQSGDSMQNLYSGMGMSSFSNGSLPPNTSGLSGLNNTYSGFENVSTPSGVFDSMNYRDPLLANLSGGNTSGSDFNIGSFLSNNANANSNMSSGNNKRSDTLDFSDFLVASPPGMTQSPPVTNNFFQMPSNNGQESNSSSSLPTLSSLSNTTSPASTHPSPQTSLNTGSSSTGASSANGTPNWLPYDVPYTHPLIQHVMRDQVQQDKAQFESQMHAIPRSGPCDIDGLCNDMQMKATCKDHARDRIAKAIQTDEMTMKLYQDYLATAGGTTASNSQVKQTPSPNLN